MKTDVEIRIEALMRAVMMGGDEPPSITVARANAFYAFLTGAEPAK